MNAHAPQCGWHCDQYDFECTCGATRPATLAWASAEVMGARMAVGRENERLAIAEARLREMEDGGNKLPVSGNTFPETGINPAAAVEIGELATRILALAPSAGLYVGIKVEPARAASAIEARRAATGTGAVEDESAVPKADAQKEPHP